LLNNYKACNKNAGFIIFITLFTDLTKQRYIFTARFVPFTDNLQQAAY
jgi:hypothetical protein